MSESIPIVNFNNASDNQLNTLGYHVYDDPDHPGFVRVTTTEFNDVIELIWHEDGTLTIVVNDDVAIRLDAIQAKMVLIDSAGGNDYIFVTGDTPEGNTLRLFGGYGDDSIVGSNGNEWIDGYKGNDTLWGMGGDDSLYSHHSRSSDDKGGVDKLYGGDGDDKLHGGKEDQVHGNAGEDSYYGGIQYWDFDDANPTGAENYRDPTSQHSDPAPSWASDSNAANIGIDSPVAGAEPDEPEPDADIGTDLGPGPAPEDLPVADDPDSIANYVVPEEPAVPSGLSADEQRQAIFDQIGGFYTTTIDDLEQASAACLEEARLAAEAGDMDAAKGWAAKADFYASQAERLSASAEVRFGLAVPYDESDSVNTLFENEYEAVEALNKLASDARENANEAEEVASGVASEDSEPRPVADEPSASGSEATQSAPSPPLPSTLDLGDTAAGQVLLFSDQLTGFYADEIAKALDDAQTHSEDAQTHAASGDTEAAEQSARAAIRASARADQLLIEAQARLDAAEVQLNEVLNDPDSTQLEKDIAQEQFDAAEKAVKKAEDQAAEAAGFAEDARTAAGLSEDDDGTIPPSEDATTEPDTEEPVASGDEPESGAEGSESDGEELVSEESEAPNAAAGSESGDDPYDQAMNNASEGTNRQESDRRSRGARSGNFLVAMAEALGLMQAKFLGNALTNLETMNKLSEKTFDKDDFNGQRQHREEFLIAQSSFQAEMQMFNIISQASATALRSTGEGMAAVVRKN